MKIHMDATDKKTYAVAFAALKKGKSLRSVVQKNRIVDEHKKTQASAQSAAIKRLAKTLVSFAG